MQYKKHLRAVFLRIIYDVEPGVLDGDAAQLLYLPKCVVQLKLKAHECCS